MGNYTTNLNMYKTDMATDGNDTFDFQRDINDNLDILDAVIGALSSLTTTQKTSLVLAINELVTNAGALSNLTTSAKTNLVSAINELVTNAGALSSLTTSAKTNLVSAINELVTNLGGKASKSLNNLDSTGQAIIDKKVEVEALLAQNGYAKFSWKVNNTISKIIIQWGQKSFTAKSVSASGTKTESCSFPTAFDSFGNIVIPSCVYQWFTLTPTDRTANNFKVVFFNFTTSSHSYDGYHYISVGY